MLVVNVSGGLTSALMAHLVATRAPWRDRDQIYVFANTGAEHPETLDFVHRIDERWGLGIIWLEARYLADRGFVHAVVDHDNASRKGEPFRAMAARYGVPNVGTGGRCTRELKVRPIRSYLRSLGYGPRDYETAIGIRADEIDRMSINATRDRLIYPLITLGVTKADVAAFWAARPWRLNIPEYLGNCVTCFKKSDRKLFTIGRRDPAAFNLFSQIEAESGMAGHSPTVTGEPAVFFRGKRSAEDMVLAAQAWTGADWTPAAQRSFAFCDVLDAGDGGCSESCEAAE